MPPSPDGGIFFLQLLNRLVDFYPVAVIFNHMVNKNTQRENRPDQLDRLFHALADRTRRDMLKRLSKGEQRVSELAAPFAMSLAAASKHIKVLESAGLVSRSIAGRTHHCRLSPGELARAHAWLGFYEKFWTDRLDALEAELRAPVDEPSIDKQQANNESTVSKSRTAAGPGRKRKRK